MSSLRNLILPTSDFLGSIATIDGQNYKISAGFGPSSAESWGTGLLINGVNKGGNSINRFIPSSSGTQNRSFQFTGNGQPIQFLFFVSSTGGAANRGSKYNVNIAWNAAESRDRGGIIWVEGTTSTNFQSPVSSGTNLTLAGVTGVDIFKVNNWFGSDKNLKLTLDTSESYKFEDSLFSMVVNDQGQSYGVFPGISELILPGNEDLYIVSFIKPIVDQSAPQGHTVFDFDIGDPRKDGSMDIEEV